MSITMRIYGQRVQTKEAIPRELLSGGRTQVKSQKFPAAANVNKTIRYRRIAAGVPTKHLRAGLNFEIAGIGRAHLQLTSISQDQQVIAALHHGAGTGLRLFPHHFAAIEFHATQHRTGVLERMTMKAIKITIVCDSGGIMRGKSIILFPKNRGLV